MRQCPVLVYHWFQAPGSSSLDQSHHLEITPGMFARQMRLLQRLGYQTVPLRAILSTENRPQLPAKPLVITFDDGTLDFWEFGKPILEKYGFTATLFIVTGYVGKDSGWDRNLGIRPRPLMGWEQITKLHAAGFEIGSHTHTHRPFTNVGEGDVRMELSKSRKILTDKLGVSPEFVAYPRGFYHARHKQMVREAGYQGACSVVLGVRDLLRSDRFELMRVMVKKKTSIAQFCARLWLSGVIPLNNLDSADKA
jgi:peptidoglycan/xylan/chitin deacetylase (PgdA/CDA1 family)